MVRIQCILNTVISHISPWRYFHSDLYFLLILFQSQPTVRPATITTRRGAQTEKVQTRGMRKELERKDELKLQQQGIRKPNAALLEAKRKAKQQLLTLASGDSQLKDIYQRAMDTLKCVRGETGLVFDNRMAEHKCLWDPKFPECPERFTRVMER